MKPRALIVDDEPYYLEWLIEFLESKGYEVETAVNCNEAFDAIEKEIFKMVIVDLQIPSPGSAAIRRLRVSDPLFDQYPGMAVAQFARDLGHWDDQVIIYSVHMGEGIVAKAKQLYCTYLPKGRPDILKEAVMAALKRGERREQRRVAARAAKENRKEISKKAKPTRLPKRR